MADSSSSFQWQRLPLLPHPKLPFDRTLNLKSKIHRSIYWILVFQGKLSAVIKRLDRENSPGFLSLSGGVVDALKENHPLGAKTVWPDSAQHLWLLDEQMIYNATRRIKKTDGFIRNGRQTLPENLLLKIFDSEGKALWKETAAISRIFFEVLLPSVPTWKLHLWAPLTP